MSTRRVHVVRCAGTFDVQVSDAIGFTGPNGEEVVLDCPASNAAPFIVDLAGDGNDTAPNTPTRRTLLVRVTDNSDPTNYFDEEVLEAVGLTGPNGKAWVLHLPFANTQSYVFDNGFSYAANGNEILTTDPTSATRSINLIRVDDTGINPDATDNYVTVGQPVALSLTGPNGKQWIHDFATEEVLDVTEYDDNGDPPPNSDPDPYVEIIDGGNPITGDTVINQGPLWQIIKATGGGRYFVLGGSQLDGSGGNVPAPVLVIRDDNQTKTYTSAHVPTVKVDVVGNPAIDGDDSVTHRYLDGAVVFSTPFNPLQFDRAGNLYVADGSNNISKRAKKTGADVADGVTAPSSLLGFDVYQNDWFYTLTFESSQTVIRRLSFNPDQQEQGGWTTRVSGVVPIGGAGGNAMGVDIKGNVWVGLADGSLTSYLRQYDRATGEQISSVTFPAAAFTVTTWNADTSEDPTRFYTTTGTSSSPGLIAIDTDGTNGVAVVQYGGDDGTFGLPGDPIHTDLPPNLTVPTLNSYGPTGALNWKVPITPPANLFGSPTSVAAVKKTIAVIGVWGTPSWFGPQQQTSYVTGYSTKTGAQLWTKTGTTGTYAIGDDPPPFSGALSGSYSTIFRSPH